MGYESRILGQAIFKVASRKFTAFELVAVGKRWGIQETRDSAVPSPMGFALTIPPGNDPRDHAPPRFRVIDSSYWK